MHLFRNTIAALAVVAACAPAWDATTLQEPPRTSSRLQNHLTASELQATASSDLYEAVRRLRPIWLSARRRSRAGDLPVVYLDNVRLGGLARLSDIDVHQVVGIRFYGALDATTRWGPYVGGGVIQVQTHR